MSNMNSTTAVIGGHAVVVVIMCLIVVLLATTIPRSYAWLCFVYCPLLVLGSMWVLDWLGERFGWGGRYFLRQGEAPFRL